MHAIITALLLAGAAGLSLSVPAQAASRQPTQTPAQTPIQATAQPRPQAEKIAFNSAEMQGGKPLSLSAIWVRAAAIDNSDRKPTVIALHSCGGLYSIIRGDKSVLTPRSAGMVRELRNAGYNVLLPDSLTPRGKNSICTESLQQRDVSTAQRAGDVQGALRWLAKQDDVDPNRIALLGWSHGGAAVMKALAAPQERGVPRPKAAIAFYPDCAPFAPPRAAYKPSIPLLILMGEEDDWAPVAPCAALAEKAGAQAIKLNVYPDSYHEFDAPGMPVHVRLDVPNPQHPGQGVTSGGNSEARVQAYRDMFRFLEAELK